MKKLLWLIPILLILPGIVMLYAAVFGATFSEGQIGSAFALGALAFIVFMMWGISNA